MNTHEVLSPTDIIRGILTFASTKYGIKKLPTERKILHPIFFKLRAEGWALLQEFPFDTHDIFPYSSTIDEAFTNMQGSNDLCRRNPALAELELDPSLESYFDNELKDKIDESELTKISKRFSEELLLALG